MKPFLSSKYSAKGSVLLIAGLLCGSAVLRIFSGASVALANGEIVPRPLPEIAQIDSTAIDAPEDTPSRSEMSSLLKALIEREDRVEQRETHIDVREKALAVARAEIERRLKVLEETEAQLRATLSRADSAAEDDVARLTTVYESMKPKDAAALFEEMEPEFAAGFLARMRPDVAASVMAGLKPQTAYTISVILAGRNARAPKT
ncbi:hypothetical protein [Pseudosulfitobacter sp. DSM 107133]|uniref:MotE family protein n=1 Tax=Pseudosulfitobacter sp. DSM 107133 TaxID=2883100 RepID=UPI000DF1FA6B|nr:hypothetical protein [Pseudosulfitobacter sp. DSM 107133]UOA28809.1 hypothetical protein DSM107133_03567 [Pseudosulfitobacter sp. DSM 107133]